MRAASESNGNEHESAVWYRRPRSEMIGGQYQLAMMLFKGKFFRAR